MRKRTAGRGTAIAKLMGRNALGVWQVSRQERHRRVGGVGPRAKTQPDTEA